MIPVFFKATLIPIAPSKSHQLLFMMPAKAISKDDAFVNTNSTFNSKAVTKNGNTLNPQSTIAPANNPRVIIDSCESPSGGVITEITIARTAAAVPAAIFFVFCFSIIVIPL